MREAIKIEIHSISISTDVFMTQILNPECFIASLPLNQSLTIKKNFLGVTRRLENLKNVKFGI